MSDLELQKSVRRGDMGGQVRLVQEWLCLQQKQLELQREMLMQQKKGGRDCKTIYVGNTAYHNCD